MLGLVSPSSKPPKKQLPNFGSSLSQGSSLWGQTRRPIPRANSKTPPSRPHTAVFSRSQGWAIPRKKPAYSAIEQRCQGTSPARRKPIPFAIALGTLHRARRTNPRGDAKCHAQPYTLQQFYHALFLPSVFRLLCPWYLQVTFPRGCCGVTLFSGTHLLKEDTNI